MASISYVFSIALVNILQKHIHSYVELASIEPLKKNMTLLEKYEAVWRLMLMQLILRVEPVVRVIAHLAPQR